MMDIRKIRELIELLKEYDLAEIELEIDGEYVKIRDKEMHNLSCVPSVSMSEPQMRDLQLDRGSVAEKENVVEITSPMVGTFYRAPAPDAQPYVKEGDKVEVGQVVCIIEAMKLMNEIKSEVSGVVERILVENGQPVEYGQPLFLIRVG